MDGFKNARKLDVGIMISDEMGHNPQAPGPAKKQAHFAEGKTPKEDTTFIDRRSYRSLRKPESGEGTIDDCLACRIYGYIRTSFIDQRNSAMLVRMTEC